MDGSNFGGRSDTLTRFDRGAGPGAKGPGLAAGLAVYLGIVAVTLALVLVLGHPVPVIEGL